MKHAALAFVVVLAASSTACGGDGSEAPTAMSDTETSVTTTAEPTEDLGAFFRRRIEYDLWGQHGSAWDALHPGQQKLVSRGKYVDCREQAIDVFPSLEVKSLRVMRTYEDPIDVIGIPEKTSTAVSVKVTLTDPGVRDQVFRDSFHAIAVDGQWVWILPPADARALMAGHCPT